MNIDCMMLKGRYFKYNKDLWARIAGVFLSKGGGDRLSRSIMLLVLCQDGKIQTKELCEYSGLETQETAPHGVTWK